MGGAYEAAGAEDATGSRKLKIAPCGEFGVALIRPPCASTIDLLIDSPIPSPLCFVV
jgi:hypothetical protein